MNQNPINFGFYYNGVAGGITPDHELLIPFVQHQLAQLKLQFGAGSSFSRNYTLPSGAEVRLQSFGGVDRALLFVSDRLPPPPPPVEEEKEVRAPYLWVGIKKLSGGEWDCRSNLLYPEETDLQLMLHVWEPSDGEGGTNDNEIVNGRGFMFNIHTWERSADYPLGPNKYVLMQWYDENYRRWLTDPIEYGDLDGSKHNMYHVPVNQHGYDPSAPDDNHDWARVVIMDPAEIKHFNPVEEGEGVSYITPTVPYEKAFQLPGEDERGIRGKWIPGEYAIKVSALGYECDNFSEMEVLVKIVVGKDPHRQVYEKVITFPAGTGYMDVPHAHIPFGFEDWYNGGFQPCYHGKWWQQGAFLADPRGTVREVESYRPRGIESGAYENTENCNPDAAFLIWGDRGALCSDFAVRAAVCNQYFNPFCFCSEERAWMDLIDYSTTGYPSIEDTAEHMASYSGWKCENGEFVHNKQPSDFYGILQTPYLMYGPACYQMTEGYFPLPNSMIPLDKAGAYPLRGSSITTARYDETPGWGYFTTLFGPDFCQWDLCPANYVSCIQPTEGNLWNWLCEVTGFHNFGSRCIDVQAAILVEVNTLTVIAEAKDMPPQQFYDWCKQWCKDNKKTFVTDGYASFYG